MLRFSTLCFTFLVTFSIAQADPDGKSGRLLSNSGGCGDCHGNASSNTSISFVSKSGSFTVLPGSKTEFKAIVAHASKSGAGINIGVKSAPNSNTNAGTLEIIAGQGLKKSASELVHTSPKAMTAGKAEFSFNWTAPIQEGVYYLMATGNAVNRNGGDSGDEWNYMAPIQITVAATTSVNEIQAQSTLRIFPNPIQELSMFQYTLQSSSRVSYSIINMMGQTLFTQNLGYQESGLHGVSLLGFYPLLGSGHYMIMLQTDDGTQTIPFVKQ
jgi:hypothetical protein